MRPPRKVQIQSDSTCIFRPISAGVYKSSSQESLGQYDLHSAGTHTSLPSTKSEEKNLLNTLSDTDHPDSDNEEVEEISQSDVCASTTSFWSYVAVNHERFINPDYAPSPQDVSCLPYQQVNPLPSRSGLRLWREYERRWVKGLGEPRPVSPVQKPCDIIGAHQTTDSACHPVDVTFSTQQFDIDNDDYAPVTRTRPRSKMVGIPNTFSLIETKQASNIVNTTNEVEGPMRSEVKNEWV